MRHTDQYFTFFINYASLLLATMILILLSHLKTYSDSKKELSQKKL